MAISLHGYTWPVKMRKNCSLLLVHLNYIYLSAYYIIVDLDWRTFMRELLFLSYHAQL